MATSSSPRSRGRTIPWKPRAFHGLRVGVRGWGVFLLATAVAVPRPAHAQFGALEALAGNVTDLSFFGGFGSLFPAASAMASGERFSSFGVELLFQIASMERPVPGATPPSQADSVRLSWTRMEIVRSEEGVDTVYFYDVKTLPPPLPPTDTIWTVEMGIGYGQISGFDLSDPSLQLRGSVRDLPAATVYASYEPWSTYFGLRTGFMKTKSLQVFERETGTTFSGESEAFLAAALVGYAWSVGGFFAFTEAAYTVRYFPSVTWSGGPLAPGIPTDLQLSGWSLSGGIQFPIR